MIRSATVLDIPEIKKIWDQSFDDPLSYVDFLFDKVMDPNDTLVYEEEGEIVSMAMSIYCSFRYHDDSIPCVYIYGCATRPDKGGRGLMTELISCVESNALARDCQMAVLVPGNRSLFRFYGKRGYNPDFSLRRVQLRSGMLETVPRPEVAIEYDRLFSDDFHEIREKALYEIPHIEWRSDQLDFMTADALAYEDHIASYSGESGKAYAIYSLKKRAMFIREILGTSEESGTMLLAGLVDEQNPKRVSMNLPVGGGILPFEGRNMIYGMSKSFKTAKPMSSLEPYMNLMLD
ncbi:MAG: GNAT family N-acetyltransferase [Oscillospiraceae bacterium]|jgi:predicted acetyltransferase|nr:GNAT family N-acetyltransferase [Oscillospiraceae bacterium]MBP1555828.1 GNAT family N-acetyltransferase [Oscillospiraceae bacterium]